MIAFFCAKTVEAHPHWSPATLAGVGDDLVGAFFAPLGADELGLADGEVTR
ncbi:hypothetical protein [Candidatus Protofrankia californiensis]|uniref:hypothetical protein n=1 Tax=Candidatus Protofrankia californiensis TaxID=1839754 RepID=UPI0019D211CD|nr:hypothetical protein [Candidatus Protofrankia californiensis]